jgi:hypothetical protein
MIATEVNGDAAVCFRGRRVSIMPTGCSRLQSHPH